MSASETAAWLRAQVEADKAAAMAVRDHSAPWDGQWQARGRHALETYNGWVLAVAGVVGADFRVGVLEHIVIHDPRDVIADCDAKLAILDLYERTAVIAKAPPQRWAANRTGLTPPQPVMVSAQDYLDAQRELTVLVHVVRVLASGYRHRDGWQEGWAA